MPFGSTIIEPPFAFGSNGGSTTLEPPLAPKGNIPFPSPTPVTAFIAAGAAGQDGAPPESDPAQPDEQTNLERFPKAVCDAGWEAYTKRVGAVNYGRFRKALLPVYQSRESEHPTAEQLVGAVEAFVEARDAEPPQYRGKYTVEHYASQLHGYVRIGAMPHMDEWGEPTERGRICGFGVGA